MTYVLFLPEMLTQTIIAINYPTLVEEKQKETAFTQHGCGFVDLHGSENANKIPVRKMLSSCNELRPLSIVEHDQPLKRSASLTTKCLHLARMLLQKGSQGRRLDRKLLKQANQGAQVKTLSQVEAAQNQ
jgi:hypothetical protein